MKWEPREMGVVAAVAAFLLATMLAVAPALLLMHLPASRLVAAYAILLAAVAYNVVVRWYMQRRPELFASGYITTVADSALNISMVLVGGGFDSPFSYILFTVTISVAMRYGYGPALAMTLLFIAADAGESILFRQPLRRAQQA